MIIDLPGPEIAAKVVAVILAFCLLVRHAAWLAEKLCEAAIYVLEQGAVVAKAVRNAAAAWKVFWKEWDEARKAWRRSADDPTSQQPPGEHAENDHRRKRRCAGSRRWSGRR